MHRLLSALFFVVSLLLLSPAHAATTTQIVNPGNQLCLGIAGPSTASLAPVTQFTCKGGTDTAWTLADQGDGYYQVVAQASGMCLSLNAPNNSSGTWGTTLVQRPCGDGPGNQGWKMVPSGTGNYRLMLRSSGMCVNVPGSSNATGTQLIQWGCPPAGGASLNDQFTLTIPRLTMLKAGNSGLCLGVPGGSQAAAAAVVQTACTGKADVTWSFQTLPNGYRQLVLLSSGMCLSTGGYTKAGEGLIQYPCQGSPNDGWPVDQWSFITPGTAGYRIVSRASSQCVNIPGGSFTPGTQVVQWTCPGNVGGGLNDQFSISTDLTGTATLPSAWTGVIRLPVNPVGAASLPNGQIMMWSADQTFSFAGDSGYGNSQTNFAVFNPATGQSTRQLETSAGSNLFCTGTSMLADGRLMVAGGSSSPKTSIYDWRTNTWSAAATMNVPRGYQGNTPLSDGSVFTLGGSWSGAQGAKNGEVWSANAGWRLLTGVPPTNIIGPDPQGVYRGDNHLWLFAQANGTVFHAGPSAQMNWISTSGAGSIQSAGNRADDAFAINGNAVMYDIGKILKVGGATAYTQNYAQRTYASNAAYTIDITRGFNQRPVVTPIAKPLYGRSFASAVVLPTGQVVVVGGQTIAEPFTDTSAVLAPEIWDPATGLWNLLNPMQVPRTYHSTAVLMADGRVFVGGGGLCGDGCAQNHMDAEILSPPYLFNSNGSYATRPVLTSAPATATRGRSITVTTNSAVSSFALVRLGSVTHTVNNDQRRVPLVATQTGNNVYSLAIPADPGVVLPGYYMLFAMNAQRVPSVSASIQIP